MENGKLHYINSKGKFILLPKEKGFSLKSYPKDYPSFLVDFPAQAGNRQPQFSADFMVPRHICA